jgi:hypothetical protein
MLAPWGQKLGEPRLHWLHRSQAPAGDNTFPITFAIRLLFVNSVSEVIKNQRFATLICVNERNIWTIRQDSTLASSVVLVCCTQFCIHSKISKTNHARLASLLRVRQLKFYLQLVEIKDCSAIVKFRLSFVTCLLDIPMNRQKS